MQTRVIVIFPDVAENNPIAALRQRFDPLAGFINPHLTLVFPFASDLTTDDLRRHISESIAGMPPFPVRLEGVTGNEGEYLFLNVKVGNDNLIALHDRLYSGILRRYLSFEHAYLPHLTVGRISDAARWQSAVAEASLLDIRLDFTISDISVYTIEPDSSRPVELVVSLGSR